MIIRAHFRPDGPPSRFVPGGKGAFSVHPPHQLHTPCARQSYGDCADPEYIREQLGALSPLTGRDGSELIVVYTMRRVRCSTRFKSGWCRYKTAHVLRPLPSCSPSCPFMFSVLSLHVLRPVPSFSPSCPFMFSVLFSVLSLHVLHPVPSCSPFCTLSSPFIFSVLSLHVLRPVPSCSPFCTLSCPFMFSVLSLHVLRSVLRAVPSCTPSLSTSNDGRHR